MVYLPIYIGSTVLVWLEDNINSTRTISKGLAYPYSLFVTASGDIYVANSEHNYRVDKWAIDANISIPVMDVEATCYDLFIDIVGTIYCSQYDLHQVVKKSIDDNSEESSKVIAGTGCAGFTSNTLYYPQGIFVDINLDLYVADRYNHRIQLFHQEQFTGITKAGMGAPGTITLDYPAAIVLDGNKYMFIVDSYNNRIVGDGPTGFRCVVGCSGSFGRASNQLNEPLSMAFDSYGNILVVDHGNFRVQKFTLSTSLCSKYNHMKL